MVYKGEQITIPLEVTRTEGYPDNTVEVTLSKVGSFEVSEVMTFRALRQHAPRIGNKFNVTLERA